MKPDDCVNRMRRPSAKTGRVLGYARMSRGDNQMKVTEAKALTTAGCRHSLEEATSAGRWHRPELHRLLKHLRKGDLVVVWKLDRLSRSLNDVLHIMVRIAEAGAAFRSISERIDTTTPAGRMMMRMVCTFADFDRAMISERTIAGMAAARAEGRVVGRPRKLDAATERKIAESVISGRKSGAAMARLYDVNKGTISRIVAEYRTRDAREGWATGQ